MCLSLKPSISPKCYIWSPIQTAFFRIYRGKSSGKSRGDSGGRVIGICLLKDFIRTAVCKRPPCDDGKIKVIRRKIIVHKSGLVKLPCPDPSGPRPATGGKYMYTDGRRFNLTPRSHCGKENVLKLSAGDDHATTDAILINIICRVIRSQINMHCVCRRRRRRRRKPITSDGNVLFSLKRSFRPFSDLNSIYFDIHVNALFERDS